MAVRRRVPRHHRRDDAAPAGAVVDDDLLAEALGQLLSELAGHDVGAAAGRKTHDGAYRAVRKSLLRPSGGANREAANRQQP